MKVAFSIDLFDDDGDVFEYGIYLHFDNKVIIRLESFSELQGIAGDLNRIVKEIADNYGEDYNAKTF
jgi:hypothetical protein